MGKIGSVLLLLFVADLVVFNFRAAKMDPVLTLKRSSQIDVNACIFCQTSVKDEHLRAATDYSRTVVRDAMNLRSKFRDVGNRETISRLEEVINIVLILQSFGMSNAIPYLQAKTKFSAWRKSATTMRRLQDQPQVRVKRVRRQNKLIGINVLSVRFIRMSAYRQL